MTVLDTIDHVAGAGYALQLLFMGEKFSEGQFFLSAFAGDPTFFLSFNFLCFCLSQNSERQL